MLADDLENARAARSTGLDLAIAGIPFSEIEARLRSAGYAEATIGRVMPNVAAEMETAYRNNARRSLIFGLSIIGAGLLVSLFSLAAYGFSGVLVVTWGVLAFGAALTWRGLSYQRRLRAFLASHSAVSSSP